MTDREKDAVNDLLGRVYSGQAPRALERHIEVNTPSGRQFKYELSEYPVRAGMTPEAALAMARRIFREKYRYTEWDRKHPQVDVEKEITTELVARILRLSEAVQRMNARKPKVFASWAIVSGGQVVVEFPYRERAEAEQRLAELLKDKPGQYRLTQIKRTEG